MRMLECVCVKGGPMFGDRYYSIGRNPA